MKNSIVKTLDINAPVARVWRALTDHAEFGAWFGVSLERPFAVGQTNSGQLTIKGFEHLVLEVQVQKMDTNRLFSYTWHPYAVDADTDYSGETPTLVEFSLEASTNGTLLTITESGFDKIPAHRRDEAWRMNDGGWAAQIKNIANHVAEPE
ncbi:SRPBCC family protein [Woeseia oceani]|uniref:Vanillate O-demethylase oxidoreductase VanB n=1 Tax=Woeseia oceani TaxID=1548547 RepID=A0A193LHT8_9GAMM|nr:SRPBCC family protein [Woeseia oceani]ANO52061.1 vanillate O-demethylase oxidoreductase VanB [Woeseia oceani]